MSISAPVTIVSTRPGQRGQRHDLRRCGSGYDHHRRGIADPVRRCGCRRTDRRAGADRFAGTLAELNGDTVTDFTRNEDALSFGGVSLFRDDVSAAGSGANTALTVRQGAEVSTVALAGSQVGGDFFVTRGDTATESLIKYIDLLPNLVELQAVSAAQINGIEQTTYLSGLMSGSFTVSLNASDAVADFSNSLGVYKIGANGTISGVDILFANVKNGGSITIDNVAAR